VAAPPGEAFVIPASSSAPWLAPTSVLRGRFAPRGARRWRSALELPLDGLVTVELRIPRGRTDTLTRPAGSGREDQVLGRRRRAAAAVSGVWTAPPRGPSHARRSSRAVLRHDHPSV